jgi:3',5'-cyclic AMP phosphodiesterase CpdA
MKTIAHISDLHFGTETATLVAGLRSRLQSLAPDLVVISGDLTQRAKIREFKAAKQFIDSLDLPCLVVPGNHDIPLYNVVLRFVQPLKRYQRYITSDMFPFHQDDKLAVLGINTAHSLTWKSGRISAEQMQQIHTHFCDVSDNHYKILVTHHPFISPKADSKDKVVDGALKLLEMVKTCHLDLLLAGHFHMSYAGGTHLFFTTLERSVLSIQAGTAVSRRTRVRHESNAFNLIRLSENQALITVWIWNGLQFAERRSTTYLFQENRWLPTDGVLINTG